MPKRLVCVGSDICDELRGQLDTSFTLTYKGDPPSRIVMRTPNLRILADMSPLTLGHMLILPVEHEVSFGHVAVKLGDEIDEMIGKFLPLYKTTFGRWCILEHGSSSEMNATCISHAHWHVLPVDGSHVRQLMIRDGLEVDPLDDFRGLAKAAAEDSPYFYCRDEVEHAVFGIGQRRRRQYLRSIVGEIVGIEDPLWDYALVIRRNLLRDTMDLAANWDLQNV